MTEVAVETQAARAVNLSKIYGTGTAAVRALDNVSVVLRTRPVHGRHRRTRPPQEPLPGLVNSQARIDPPSREVVQPI
jgi:hypothetical protein